jgi:hypothetical protein
MTEEEAKTKWCPQTLCARLIVSDHVEQPVEMGGARCIGSKCMAWRWERASNSSIKRKDGFCGLAGRP